MVLEEHVIRESEIKKHLGDKLSINFKKLEAFGSPGLFLKEFQSLTNQEIDIKLDSKANLEKREKGFVIHTNYSNRKTLILVHYISITNLVLKKGNEVIESFTFSLFNLLLKLKLPLRFARYFARSIEYNIDEFELTISSELYKLKLICNGYQYSHMKNFIISLSLHDKVKIIEAS